MKGTSRRDFIKSGATVGLSFWLGLSAKGTMLHATSQATIKNFSPFILVESNGHITIFSNKPEIGQGTFQSIPALIAEEFEVDLNKVLIKSTNGESEFGGQFAGGSSSVRGSYTQMRKVGASAREVFIKAAANRWQTDVVNCYAEDATVINRLTNAKLSYGDLVEDASKIELSKEPKLKDAKDFKILTKAAKRQDIPLKTNGSAEFGIDARVPGMVYATVERCPVLGGTLKSFDATEALKVPGVQKVVEIERVVGKYSSVGVAVIANSYWAALQGRKKLSIIWDFKEFETFDSAEYEAKLRSLASEPGLPDKTKGDVDAVKITAQNTVEAFSETPQIAHHPLEPLNCVAQITGDKVEIWTSTQVPSSVTGGLPAMTGFKPGSVKLNSKFTGGGFGRRLQIDYIAEAVNIAKHTDKAVKVIWTREDTTEQGSYRPMTFSKLKAGFNADGRLLTFEHKVISPSYGEAQAAKYDKSKVDGIMVEGIGEQAYEIPNVKTSYVRADYHVSLGAWRSVTSSTVAFAHECFIDELAYKVKKDPLSFRLELLTKPSDTKKVLLKLKELSNWDKPLPKGKGRGIAVWEFFAGLCGQVVEVTYNKDKSIKIDKVIAVIDLGEVVNPDNVRNQVEGAIVMALGAATKPGITLKNGRVQQHNFYDNPLVRINEVPKIEVHILTDGGKIKGVGEPGLPPFAPALANAIFAATGKRFRKMPFDLKVG